MRNLKIISYGMERRDKRMELKITIEMDKDSCWKLSSLLKTMIYYPWDEEPKVKLEVAEPTEEKAQPIDVKAEEKPKGSQAPKTVDYDALRKEIKALAIKTVQAKKKTELKALTAAYGKERIDDLEDNQLELYLMELKEL